MESTTAKIIDDLFKLFNVKNSTLLKTMKKYRSNSIPKSMRLLFSIRSFKIKGRSVVTLQRKKSFTNLHIIFLHGGAYAREPSALHWRFMGVFLERLNCKLSYIDYPLTPQSNYKDIHAMLAESYEKLIVLYPKDTIILMGDSAGGGLALAFFQILKKSKGRMPDKTVLFSPWLDISMTNPKIKQIAQKDLLLALDDLVIAATDYSGGNDMQLPILSPIYGPLDGLGEVAVFFGTHEVLLPDCLLLQEKVKDTDSRFEFFKFPNMQHDFILLPIPEAEKAIKEVCEFILG